MIKKVPWLRPVENDLSVTVITDPMPIGKYRLPELSKKYIRKARNSVRDILRPLPGYLISPYRGHAAVTRSLVEGLQKLKVPSNYNPLTLESLAQTVVVVSGMPVLRQMIELKQRGYIRRLLVGPNMLNDMATHNGLLAAPEIDVYITHAPVCPLVVRIIPELAGRCMPWAAGVDCEYWQVEKAKLRNHILVYSKQNKGPTLSPDPFVQEMKRRGYEVTVVTYGNYSAAQFRELLQVSKLMIGFTRDESQGIAWAEAWACDVPTFFWRNDEPTYLGVRYDGSAAPYLTDATGKFFDDFETFTSIVDSWERGEFNFQPRAWCLENMSDEACAREIIRISKI